MIKIAVCDDNMDELTNMASLIEKYKKHSPWEYEYTIFHNGFELIPVLEKGCLFDIYCLDIIMPGFNGIDLGREIRSFDQNAQIIFFTSSPEFAFESYSVKAVNYILKPVTREKLFFTLNEVFNSIEKEQETHIIVKSSHGLQKILLSTLVLVEAMNKKSLYYTCSGSVIECSLPFSAVCDSLLEHGCFIQTHRSYLVNMNYIDIINSTEIILHTLASVPIARNKLHEVKKRYLEFQMEGI